jgi:transcriptional regulator with XRE-family HTH domain
LESGRIQPSVQTLRNIASTLRLPYGRLALLAGYIDKDVYDTPNTQDYLKRLTDIGDLNDEEWKSVLDFARYIRSKRHE